VSAALNIASTATPISSLKYGKCHWSGASTTPSSEMNSPAVIFLMVPRSSGCNRTVAGSRHGNERRTAKSTIVDPEAEPRDHRLVDAPSRGERRTSMRAVTAERPAPSPGRFPGGQ
jgi:hypothetical protein